MLAGVAGALDPAGAEMSVTGVPSGEVSRALMDGSGAAYVLAIPSDTTLGCTEPALHSADSPTPGAAGQDPHMGIVPLIQTRATAIVRLDAIARIAATAASPSFVVEGQGGDAR
jgi:hypothetical protein